VSHYKVTTRGSDYSHTYTFVVVDCDTFDIISLNLEVIRITDTFPFVKTMLVHWLVIF